ncbi:AF4/FMR2 family member 4 [Scaptodrosophila lebanonensis]|uniref:AF4/FMR2 family member 4 n=1 Tax=Drosophila lebanonensis TaxID=7225 RepID=A0A6J2TLX8_DROLE|nr:AF4/FMR2 family member 4 [Scaptodrosophila lebanonensis]
MTTSDEMGTFCHDHIQHPLMWCDEKKRLVERKNAEESLRMWRRRKAEEVARKEKDKQEYYDLFLQHCPWGRPGGGAPNVDVRRKDITAVGLHSTPTVTAAHRINSLHPCRYSELFSTQKKCHNNPLAAYHHHHLLHPTPAPTGARLAHAHSIHHLQESGPRSSTVTICEREMPPKPNVSLGGTAKNGERHVDIELRYKPSPQCKGKPLLDKIVVSESDRCPLQSAHQEKLASQKKKLQAKLEKPPSKEPWGKAGPGGKPWRSPKEVGNTFMKSLGWTNKEMLKELDQDNPVTPAEKSTFRKSRAPKQIKMQRCCELCTCTCPAMNSPQRALSKKVPPAPVCGLGSPPKLLHPPKPVKLCPRLARHCTIMPGRSGPCPVASTSTTTATPDASTAAGAGGAGGGVELVPLLARRRAINRPISLSSTDVTKRTPSHDRYASKHKTKNSKCNNNSHSKCKSNSNSNNNSNNNINSIIKNISHMKRLPKNLNCKLQCCSCACGNSATATVCCLKRLTLHIR